jgi:hypothetical protein
MQATGKNGFVQHTIKPVLCDALASKSVLEYAFIAAETRLKTSQRFFATVCAL